MDKKQVTSNIYPGALEQNNATPTKKRTLLIVVLAVVGVVVLIFVLLILLVFISLSGGIRGAIADITPDVNPNSKKVVQERNTAKTNINNAFDTFNQALHTTPMAKSVTDQCYRGQNNWKVKDNYANRCTIKVTNYYGFSTDFKPTMLSLEKELKKNGWQFDGPSSISGVIVGYYDKYYGPDKAYLSNYPNGYLVSDLPPVGADIPNNNLKVSIFYAEKATKTPDDIELNQEVGTGTLSITYNQKEKVDPQAVFSTVFKDNKYLLGVSVTSTYYRD